VLQPIVNLSLMAVDQADKYLKTGATGVDEKQSWTASSSPDNANGYKNFAPVSGAATQPAAGGKKLIAIITASLTIRSL